MYKLYQPDLPSNKQGCITFCIKISGKIIHVRYTKYDKTAQAVNVVKLTVYHVNCGLCAESLLFLQQQMHFP